MALFDKWKKRTEPLQAPPKQPQTTPSQPQHQPQKPQQQTKTPQLLDDGLEKALFAEVELFKCFPDQIKVLQEGTRDEIIRLLLEKTNGKESRIQLAAWNELRKMGVEVPADLFKKVLGVVLEVGLYGGVDYLAAYSDHTARYYNFSGAKVIWENEENEMSSAIDKLIQAGQIVADHIGIWDEERRKGVAEEMIRMTFLTPSGLYFGEGEMSAMLQDHMAQSVIINGMELMKQLMDKT